MKAGRLSLVSVCLLLVAFVSEAAVVGKEVSYEANGKTMKGYIAYDDKVKGKRPGVLVVHEWWGHNDYSRKRANMLAELGYTALALDMYGDGKQASHPKEAGAMAGEVKKNMKEAEARFNAARELLMKHETTDSKKIAAIGYCFGGGVVLEMARRGVDLDAVVSFHGSLATSSPAKPGDIKARVLICHGADDPFIKPEHITAIKKEMKPLKSDFVFKDYPNAKHAFTNPAADENGKKFNIPLAYNAEADKKSWADMQKFLQDTFK